MDKRIGMAPVHSCTCDYACLLLLVVVPHDLTRDILNGIFGRGRSGDWGEGKEREGGREQLRFPWDRLAGSRRLSTGEKATCTELVPEQIYQG